MARTIFVNVNLDGGVGAADWRDNQDDLPTYAGVNDRYVVTVPDGQEDDTEAITDAMDAFLGDYDLPDGWEQGPLDSIVVLDGQVV